MISLIQFVASRFPRPVDLAGKLHGAVCVGTVREGTIGGQLVPSPSLRGARSPDGRGGVVSGGVPRRLRVPARVERPRARPLGGRQRSDFDSMDACCTVSNAP